MHNDDSVAPAVWTVAERTVLALALLGLAFMVVVSMTQGDSPLLRDAALVTSTLAVAFWVSVVARVMTGKVW